MQSDRFGLLPRPEYRNAKLSDIDKRSPSDLLKLAKQFAKMDRDSIYKGINLYMYGSYRVGKTWMLHAIANRLIELNEKSLFYVTAPILQMGVQKNLRLFDYPYLDYLCAVRFLMLDDLGQEYRGAQSGFIETTLEYLIRYRFNNARVTYIATNGSLENIQQIYGSSLFDFINGEYVIFNVEEKTNMSVLLRNDRLRKNK